MRRDWRNVLLTIALFLLGATWAVARQDGDPPKGGSATGECVRLTVELAWSSSNPDSEFLLEATNPRDPDAQSEVMLEVMNGRVVDVMTWPVPSGSRGGDGLRDSRSGSPSPGPRGTWNLGTRGEGRVRARIEAPVDSSLVLRRGDQAVGMPLAAVLERPQRTPPQSRLNVTVERLPWDAIIVDLGESARDGVVAPGAVVPVSVGYNIIWPEASEVSVRTTAVLRPLAGGDVLWRDEPREVVPANLAEPPSRIWSVRAPWAEGTYILEIKSTWEPASARDGGPLARLIRRRRPSVVATSAVRRVSFTVVDPEARVGNIGLEGSSRDTEVDSVDLSRARSHRPVATGRSPLAGPGRVEWGVPAAALLEPSRRDRLRGWFTRNGGEAAKLDAADAGGLAWTAIGLKVTHPDRAHRLKLEVMGGEPSALGVALVETNGGAQPASPSPGVTNGASTPARLVLDACASGPPILQDGPPAVFEWVVFPRSSEMVLVMVNRSPEAEVRAGAITLTEIEGSAAPPSKNQRSERGLGLYLTGIDSLDRFGSRLSPGDPIRTAQNLVQYMSYCGATAVVMPEDLTDRNSRRKLSSQADEDPTRPDRVEVVRRILARQGYSLWLELGFEGPDSLPGLPPADSAEALNRGLVRLDNQGQAESRVYHPLHPDVREAMKRRLISALDELRPGEAGSHPGGLVMRLGPGPTLLGTPDTGLDDATYRKFAHDTIGPGGMRHAPSMDSTDPGRFAERSRYLAGIGRMPWLTWRTKEIAALYTELNDALHAASPSASLAVVTPSLDGGPAGGEARRVDRAAQPPSQSWRSVGLDFKHWPVGPQAPVVLRGTALSTEALSHDLATSPELDSLVASRSQRGVLLAINDGAGDDLGGGSPAPETAVDGGPQTTTAVSASPGLKLAALPLGDGPAADEPLGHALAALDSRWVFLAEKAASGHEERLRRFARVLCALPAKEGPADIASDAVPRPFGVVVRKLTASEQTFLEIANNSPYPIRLAGKLELPAGTALEDVGRGVQIAPIDRADGTNLVLDFLPYGVAAIKIGAPQVQLVSVNTFPSEAVMTTMRARFNELSSQLKRVNQGLSLGPGEPANCGFEPPANVNDPPGEGPLVKVTAARTGTALELAGWQAEGPAAGEASIKVDRDNPHAGQGSLRLYAPAAPASVISESFVPNNQSSLTIEAYFRASEPETKVRVWIEGTSGGKPYVRRTEMTVSTGWEGRAVRASDVPAGGLDSARLRFELLAPGSLWIDDVHIPNETTSRSGILNARRTMQEAIQAYKEGRYAEFARLASSHWIRESSAAATTRLARATERGPQSGGGGSARPDGASSSALSPDRKRR